MRQISTASRESAKDLAEGLARAANKWGTYEEDYASGKLGLAYWGTSEHYDPRDEAEWGYGSLLGERDLMLHKIANYPLHWMPGIQIAGKEPYLTAEQAAQITADAMIPYQGDAFMLDYSDGPTGIYSEHKVKQVAWVKHYEKFWIGSNGFCGWRWPMCFTNNYGRLQGPDAPGRTQVFQCRYRQEHYVRRRHGAWAQDLHSGPGNLDNTGQAPGYGSLSGLCLRAGLQGGSELPMYDDKTKNGPTRPVRAGNWIAPSLRSGRPGSMSSRASTRQRLADKKNS